MKGINKYNKYKITNIKKFIKINNTNIYKYLTSSDILYINNKIKLYLNSIIFNLIDIIKLYNDNWLIKNKNILLINYKNIIFSININNLDDIILYNKYKKITNFLLNNIIKNKTSLKYSNDIIIRNKYTTSNYNVIIKKNLFNKIFSIFYNIKNFKLTKLIDENLNFGNVFYYYKYNIYIKFWSTYSDWYLNYRQEAAIRKIKLLLI